MLKFFIVSFLIMWGAEEVYAQNAEIPMAKKVYKLKQKGEIFFRLKVFYPSISCEDQESIYLVPNIISKKGSSHAILNLDINYISTLVDIECDEEPIAGYKLTPWNSINVQVAKTIQFNYPRSDEYSQFELIVQRERPCNLEDIRYCD